MLDVLIDLDYRRRLYTVGDIARRDMLSTFSRLSFIGEENSNYRVFVYRVFFRRPRLLQVSSEKLLSGTLLSGSLLSGSLLSGTPLSEEQEPDNAIGVLFIAPVYPNTVYPINLSGSFAQVHVTEETTVSRRPYCIEPAGSHLNSIAKRCKARLVLDWGTVRELQGVDGFLSKITQKNPITLSEV